MGSDVRYVTKSIRAMTNRLQQTLFDLQTRYGDYAIQTAKTAPLRTLPTGFAALDAALSRGGVVCGRITTLITTGTSGALTVGYHLLGRGQSFEAFTAYLDLNNSFDPEYAVGCGVTLNQLLVIRAPDALLGIEIARDLALTNTVPLVLVDLVRLADDLSAATLDRLHDGVIRAHAAVVFVVDRLTPDVEAVSHTILRFERQSWHFDGNRLNCYESRVTILKDKPQPKTESVTISIDHGGSFT